MIFFLKVLEKSWSYHSGTVNSKLTPMWVVLAVQVKGEAAATKNRGTRGDLPRSHQGKAQEQGRPASLWA